MATLMSLDAILDGIRDREGVRYAEPPAIDQPTGPYGITRAALAAARGRRCTKADLQALTPDEARAIVRARLEADLTRLHIDRIRYEPLRGQLLDFAWNSGEALAVRWLQRTLGLPDDFVTGAIDDRTIAALDHVPARLLHNALAAERAYMVRASRTIARKFKAGVIDRAISFVLPTERLS